MNATITDAQLAKLQAETAKLAAETATLEAKAKTQAEIAKLMAKTHKISTESPYYPFAAGVALVAAVITMTTLFL